MAAPRRTSRRIDALRARADDPNTVDVRVGGATVATLARSRAEALGIREGAAWTPALAGRASRAAAEELAREAALAFLARRDWSVAALRERLERAGHVPGAAAAAVEGLAKDGWLDDRAFASARVEHHRRRGAMAAEALEDLLERDGLAPGDAREAAKAGAATAAELRAEARAARAAGHAAGRVAARLARRGFDPDTIRDALERAGFDLGD